jgi:hypothetical protein
MNVGQEVQSRVYTIHGPPGVPVAALLRARAITLCDDDVLLIAEHDDATESWLDCELEAKG